MGDPFFGERWDAPIVDDARQVATPVGLTCSLCGELVMFGDRGWMRTVMWSATAFRVEPVHAECEMLGIIGHQYEVCSCTGFDTTTRASAQELWRRIGVERGRPLEVRQ